MIQQLQQHYNVTTHNVLDIVVRDEHEADLLEYELEDYDNNYSEDDIEYEFDDYSLFIATTRYYTVLGHSIEVCYSTDYDSLEDYIDARHELGHDYY
jgi:hypothetical protein